MLPCTCKCTPMHVVHTNLLTTHKKWRPGMLYIYIYLYIYIFAYIYICIYIERERERLTFCMLWELWRRVSKTMESEKHQNYCRQGLELLANGIHPCRMNTWVVLGYSNTTHLLHHPASPRQMSQMVRRNSLNKQWRCSSRRRQVIARMQSDVSQMVVFRNGNLL